MTQIRERTLELLAYRDAITDAIQQGITKSSIRRALQTDAGIEITIRGISYYLDKYLNEDTSLDVPQLPLPSLYRRPGLIAPVTTEAQPFVGTHSPTSRDQTVRPVSLLPSPLPASHEEVPPSVQYNPPYKNIYSMGFTEQGPMTDWIPLEDGARARWGYWRGGVQFTVQYDCEIESPIQSVRLAVVPGHDANIWFYQEDIGPIAMRTYKNFTDKAKERGLSPDDLLDDRYPVKIGHFDTVKKYHDWYLEQKANAKEY
jgi:hypothetical protein